MLVNLQRGLAEPAMMGFSFGLAMGAAGSLYALVLSGAARGWAGTSTRSASFLRGTHLVLPRAMPEIKPLLVSIC